MKPFTLCLTVLGLAAAPMGLRAETQHLAPTVFYNTLSATHPPVLRIKSGDRVVTTTVDGAGAGADGKTVAKGSNPQT